jgi:O-antigen/teichoic acid export membrane protein
LTNCSSLECVSIQGDFAVCDSILHQDMNDDSSTLKRLFSKTSGTYTLLSKIVGALLNCALIAVIKSSVEYKLFGELLFLLTVLNVFKAVFIFGLDTVIIRNIATLGPSSAIRSNRLIPCLTDISKIFSFVAIIATPILLVVSLKTLEHLNLSYACLTMFIFCGLAQAYAHLAAEVCRAMKDYRMHAIIGGPNGGLLGILSLSILVWSRSKLQPGEFISLIFQASVMISVLASIILYSKRRDVADTTSVASRRNRSVFPSRIAFSESFLCFGSHIIWELIINSPVWIAAFFLNDIQLSDFSFAYRITAPCLMLLAILESYYGPHIARAATEGNLRAIKTKLQRVACISVLPPLTLLFGVSWLGAWPIDLLFGKTTEEAITLIKVITLGHIVFAAGGSTGIVLLLFGNAKIAIAISLLTLIFQILTGYLTAVVWHDLGLAISFVLSQIFFRTLGNFACRHVTGVFTFASLSSASIS